MILRPSKYVNQTKDEILNVEKGQIRAQKLNGLMENFNADHCCPRMLINDIIEEDECPKYRKKEAKSLDPRN